MSNSLRAQQRRTRRSHLSKAKRQQISDSKLGTANKEYMKLREEERARFPIVGGIRDLMRLVR